MQGNYRVASQLVASRVVLSSIELFLISYWMQLHETFTYHFIHLEFLFVAVSNAEPSSKMASNATNQKKCLRSKTFDSFILLVRVLLWRDSSRCPGPMLLQKRGTCVKYA
jgi:hypothetical protein